MITVTIYVRKHHCDYWEEFCRVLLDKLAINFVDYDKITFEKYADKVIIEFSDDFDYNSLTKALRETVRTCLGTIEVVIEELKTIKTINIEND